VNPFEHIPSQLHHKGKTEKENNGYVVFKENIHGSAGNMVKVRGEALLRPSPPLSTAGF
jgi:hypothetical protein